MEIHEIFCGGTKMDEYTSGSGVGFSDVSKLTVNGESG
jgi:hypothetical protein